TLTKELKYYDKTLSIEDIYNNALEQTAFANWEDFNQPIDRNENINLEESQLQANEKLKIEELIDLTNHIYTENENAKNISNNNNNIEDRGNLNFNINNIINKFMGTTTESNI
ncbi:4803_t:CDS:1, partial [Cetraspora pellucida]